MGHAFLHVKHRESQPGIAAKSVRRSEADRAQELGVAAFLCTQF